MLDNARNLRNGDGMNVSQEDEALFHALAERWFSGETPRRDEAVDLPYKQWCDWLKTLKFETIDGP